MILKIIDIKNASLREKSKEVKKIDKKILKLVADMKETLKIQKDPEGVGLAAPQVGKNIRLFIMHYPEENINLKTVINPHVIKSNYKNSKIKKIIKKDDDILEGCLSLPYYYGPVERKPVIKISYQNEKGEKKSEEFTGFAAQIVQHEIDHLNGRLFIDHILEKNSPLYFIKDDEVNEVEL
jgi:peptide deformylase